LFWGEESTFGRKIRAESVLVDNAAREGSWVRCTGEDERLEDKKGRERGGGGKGIIG